MVNIIRDVKKAFNFGVGTVKKVFSENPLGLKKTTSFVVPISPASNVKSVASGIKGVASGTKSIYTSIKNAFSRATTNPFAGVGVKQGLKNMGGTLLGGGVTGLKFGVGYGIAKSLSTGEKISGGTIAKTTAYGVSSGISPIGTIFGEISGQSQNIAKSLGQSRIEDATNMFKGQGFQVPNIPQPQITNTFSLPEGFNTPLFPSGGSLIPQPITNITIPSTGGGGFSVNMPSSDMGSILPLMLLLAGGGGYLLGKRKKRKRKKYKKKKSQ